MKPFLLSRMNHDTEGIPLELRENGGERPSYSVQILSFIKLELGFTEKVVEQLRTLPEVHEIFYITGEYDLAVWIIAPSNERLYELFLEKLDVMEGVLQINSHYIMKRIPGKHKESI